MSIMRVPHYPYPADLSSERGKETYVRQLYQALQEEGHARIADFDILQLANVAWADVRTHGATGRGVVDDAPAIQSAISSLSSTGGIVLMPRGTFLLNSSLELPHYVSLIGSSYHETILKAGAAINMITTPAATGAGMCVLENFAIDGDDVALSGIRGAFLYARMRDLWIWKCTYNGIAFLDGPGSTWAGDNAVLYCEIHQNGAFGIKTNPYATDVIFHGNWISENASAGIGLYSCAVEMIGNHFFGANQPYGAWCGTDSLGGWSFTGNYFETLGRNGINVTANGVSNIQILGNRFWQNSQETTNTYDAIYLYSGGADITDITITSNIFKSGSANHRYNINLAQNVSDSIIIGNNIKDFGTGAINIDGTCSNIIDEHNLKT